MSTSAIGNKKGFTLIELVIVIILIGILAATALPKFANLTSQARNASNQGVAGALGAAVGIAHGAWIAAGLTGAGTVILDNGNVSVNDNGWPDGGGGLAPSAANCVTLWGATGAGIEGILNNPPVAQTAACTANTSCYQATASGSVCTYTFAQGTDTTITYDLSTGVVAFTVGS